jgi:Ca2+-binding EF-hand superfamily protein
MAFKVFDHNNTGRCKATELREALMYYGEKMTEAEWNDMTMGKIEREGFIYYEDLLKEIYGDRAMTTTQ